MKVAFYSYKEYDRDSFEKANAASTRRDALEITFLALRLESSTVALAKGHDAVCLFVNDDAGAEVLEQLHQLGVKYISLRCAGTDHLDIKKAESLGLKWVSVPSYSPESVAEFTVGMMLTMIRKYHKAYNRVREGNFTLSGLVGFNLAGSTIGLIGTGHIGLLTGKILSRGFGSTVIAYDPYPNERAAAEHGISYVKTLEEVLTRSDVISLHCPLTESTHHLLNNDTFPLMKKGVVLVNTSRGALIDTKALINHLKNGHIGAVGLDVYEGESDYFFHDSSSKIIQDDELSRLLSFYNVFVRNHDNRESGHQAFLTQEALQNIAERSIDGLLALQGTETS